MGNHDDDKPDTGKQYDLEPVDEPEADAPAAKPASRPAAKPQHDASDEPSSIKALDVCPNCGSPLGGIDAVVCLRCGYDLKQMKVIKTTTSAGAEVEDEEADAEAAPLSAPGVGDLWLPVAMAVGALVILTIGYFVGAGGLLATQPEEGAGFMAAMTARVEGLVRMLVRTGVMTVSGVAGLYVLAHILETRLGDLKLAAVRMLGIVAAVSLLTFFNISSEPLEWTIEAVTQALAFVGLAMVLFSLNARDAATLLGVTLFAVIGTMLLSALILWAAPPS